MRKKLLIVTPLVIVCVAVASLLLMRSLAPVVPAEVQSKVNFPIFYPAGSSAEIDKASFKYDPELEQVSFVVSYEGHKFTFAEQETPATFTDDPNFYGRFIEKLNGYSTFESINGRVDLTRPKEVQTETATMNSKGTLLFAKSEADISDDGWKSLFNSLLLTKPAVKR